MSSFADGSVGAGRPLTGSCLCGAVVYRPDGAPLDFVLCHCGRCRKTTGSAFAANLIAHPKAMVWISDGPDGSMRWDLLKASSFATAICRACGTPVPHATRNGQLMIVPAGMRDDDPGIRPRRQIFTTSQAGWCVDLEDVPVET
ncbi:GFA family protein [Gluconacetobacter tumulicola]|uniref:GFA family protein n=1 Tax=Gluconacetobacter tumulicola TaxID=1017177 RepID=A0A7W4P5I0_9PROT|nr:GFA family protein [Gluconacetobacter tumulicola]